MREGQRGRGRQREREKEILGERGGNIKREIDRERERESDSLRRVRTSEGESIRQKE